MRCEKCEIRSGRLTSRLLSPSLAASGLAKVYLHRIKARCFDGF